MRGAAPDICRPLTTKATLRNPRSLALAAGEPGTESGRTKLEMPSRVPSLSGFSMTISMLEPGMPQAVSKNSPRRSRRVGSKFACRHRASQDIAARDDGGRRAPIGSAGALRLPVVIERSVGLDEPHDRADEEEPPQQQEPQTGHRGHRLGLATPLVELAHLVRV